MDLSLLHQSQALVVNEQSSNDLDALLTSDEILKRSIEKRDQQPRGDVWEKLPHGGPYAKVDRKQTDLQVGSHVRPEDGWGYERIKIGPTTNFVGDAMTTLAVDLVREELKENRFERQSRMPPAGRAPEPLCGGESDLRKMTRDLIYRLERSPAGTEKR